MNEELKDELIVWVVISSILMAFFIVTGIFAYLGVIK